ncbi:MAG: acetolactate decarboxylase [Lachnospiraceae bacterium]|nr:acetolactate decarboxylase [Lachnospiraceae bacterium]
MIVYQVSTLQALALGHTRAVVTVKELLEHGGIGLGTFEDVNGEMIVVDGVCYRAAEDGTVCVADPDMGVPFAAVAVTGYDPGFEVENIPDISKLKEILTMKIEEVFGLNSMHIARIEGEFGKVYARSESAYRSRHIELKDILSETQRDFMFENITGTLVCVYYPDYMDGINAPGWHIHFVSRDRTKGGHVFELEMVRGHISLTKINRIEIQLPDDPAFDTYSLKSASGSDIKQVEQGKPDQ